MKNILLFICLLGLSCTKNPTSNQTSTTEPNATVYAVYHVGLSSGITDCVIYVNGLLFDRISHTDTGYIVDTLTVHDGDQLMGEFENYPYGGGDYNLVSNFTAKDKSTWKINF